MPHPADNLPARPVAKMPAGNRPRGSVVLMLCLAAAGGLGYLVWRYVRTERTVKALSTWEMQVERPGRPTLREAVDARGDEEEIRTRILNVLRSVGEKSASQPTAPARVMSVRFAHVAPEPAPRRDAGDKKKTGTSVAMETVRTWLARTADGAYYYAPDGQDVTGKLHEGLFDNYAAALEPFAGYLAGELRRLHEIHKETLRPPPTK